ncbi:MAG TPA: class I SAM-dependent methyltransferase [Acidimicrobiales bacterium]|nr:class I SAM-dependent methyltransferase [Acidimicrobiales bacterium]
MARVDYSGRMAEVYDAGRHLSDGTLSLWTEAAARHLGPGPVLDLGSGTGRFSAALSSRLGVPVVAVEPAAGMRVRAAASAPAGVWVVGGRAEALPLGPARFGGVWASQVLHHVGDLGASARELRRVLAPGGTVLVRGMLGDLGATWPLAPYFPGAVTLVHRRYPRLEALVAALAEAGLVLRAHERIRQVTAPDPGALAARTALRADSALAQLPDDEFHAGLAVLRRDVERGRLTGPVTEVLDLAVFAP